MAITSYHIYMKRLDIVGGAWIDLEATYPGLRYKELKGIENYGKKRSVYIEEFAETETPAIYVHHTSIREDIEITLTLLFVGSNRRKVYHDFVDFISIGKLEYKDDIRKRNIQMILIDAIEPTEDIFKGAEYMEASFKFRCLSGSATTIS